MGVIERNDDLISKFDIKLGNKYELVPEESGIKEFFSNTKATNQQIRDICKQKTVTILNNSHQKLNIQEKNRIEEDVKESISAENAFKNMNMKQEMMVNQMVEQMAQGEDVLNEGEVTNKASRQRGYSSVVILATVVSLLSLALIIIGSFIMHK